MSHNLAIDQRPTSFDDIVGQDDIISVLREMTDLPRLIIFHGPSGTGKTTTARVFAKTINCTGEKKPCGVCENCQNPYLLVRWDVPVRNKVSDVAEMLEVSRLATPEGTRRVILADEAHGLAASAFDKMLDALEQQVHSFSTGQVIESPTIFIFSTTEIDKIPPTIQSRALVLRFRRIASSVIRSELVKYQGEIPDEALDFIATNTSGNLRTALQQLGAIQNVADWKTVLNPEGSFAKQIVSMLKDRKTDGLLELLEQAVEDSNLKDVVVQVIVQSRSLWKEDLPYWKGIVSAAYPIQFSVSTTLGVARLFFELRDAVRRDTVLDTGAKHGVIPSETEDRVPDGPSSEPPSGETQASEAPSSSKGYRRPASRRFAGRGQTGD